MAKCLLCKVQDVYNIKSHFTPAVISENTIGKRNKEKIYIIESETKNHSKYFGPGYPQTETTEVKEAPHTKKGIFCKDCENNFGNYENAVQKDLLSLINGLNRGTIVNRANNRIKYFNINIHKNILIAFFQGIVWRQCIQQIIEGQDSPLKDDELEKLRKQVLTNNSISIKDIVNAKIESNNISAFSTYNTWLKITPSFISPHRLDTNPLVFFVGPLIVLYWTEGLQSALFEPLTKISEDLLSEDLFLDKSKVSVINSSPWERISETFSNSIAK